MYKKIEPYKDIARIYDEVRPSYPEELIQDIITATNIGPNSNLLEIGAGTGKQFNLLRKDLRFMQLS